MTRMGLLVLWGLGVSASGCATNLAMMSTARTLDPGEVRLSGGVGVYVPATQSIKLLGEGASVAVTGIKDAATQQPFQLTPDQKHSLFLSAAALSAMPPSGGFQLDARVGLFRHFDVGLRYSVDAVRADAKLRLFHSGDEDSPTDGPGRRSKDIAIGFAVSRHFFVNPTIDLMNVVKLDHFDRWDFEVPLYFSIDVSRYFGVYGVGRYIFSRTGYDQTVRQTQPACCSDGTVTTQTTTPSRLDSHFLGATAGLRVGNHRFSWLLEVTVGLTRARTDLAGETVDLGGVTLYPATGIALTF